jgi:hypothetical protein
VVNRSGLTRCLAKELVGQTVLGRLGEPDDSETTHRSAAATAITPNTQRQPTAPTRKPPVTGPSSGPIDMAAAAEPMTRPIRAGSTARARAVSMIDQIDVETDDLRAELRRLGSQIIACVTDVEGAAVIRLQFSESPRFGELVDTIRDGGRDRTQDRLAGKFGQFAATGRLRTDDPALAARHFMALVQDEVLTRSAYGARPIDPAEAAGPVNDGVDTFLAAFGPR